MRPLLPLILLLAAASPAEIDRLAKSGKLNDAIAQGRAAAAERPNDPDTRLAVARALATKARRFNYVVNVKLSQKDLERGEVKVPNANLGDSPLQPGYDASLFEEAQLNLDAAIASYDQALQLNPKNAVTYNYKGFAQYRLHRFKEAEESLRLSVAIARRRLSEPFQRFGQLREVRLFGDVVQPRPPDDARFVDDEDRALG